MQKEDTDMARFPLEDPFAEVPSKVEEAVRKGLMTRRTGDKQFGIDKKMVIITGAGVIVVFATLYQF